MKKLVYKSLLIIVASLVWVAAFSSCQKAPINGYLDGRWQLMEIETSMGVENVKDQQLYYNFYMHVCNLSFYGGVFTDANFSYENDIIFIQFPYINTLEGMSQLSNYGIFSNPVEFEVLYLDKKKLIMGNDESLITLRKF